MTEILGSAVPVSAAPTYADCPNRSPWIAQLTLDGPPRPIGSDATADVVVVGAGIAGIATAFFILHTSSSSVMLVERDRVARGAPGWNAGALATYFERPLSDIADAFGWELAGDAQRGFDDAHELLDVMVDEAGARVRVERFTGHMGMSNRNQLEVHLHCMLVREQAGLRPQTCVVSEEAEFLDELPPEFTGLYSVVPQTRVRELLEVDDDRYRAVLSAREGCANSAVLCQQVLGYLQRKYADRFVYADCTDAEREVVGADRVTLHAGGHRVTAGHAVLCTNGFVDHIVEDAAGSPIRLAAHQQITGRVGYMTAFVDDAPRPPAAMSYIRNIIIGGDTAYAYVTRRSYDRAADTVTLICMGGPEYRVKDVLTLSRVIELDRDRRACSFPDFFAGKVADVDCLLGHARSSLVDEARSYYSSLDIVAGSNSFRGHLSALRGWAASPRDFACRRMVASATNRLT